MSDVRMPLEPPVGGRRLRLSTGGAASPDEAAAIVAAVERFMRETAPPRLASNTGPEPWARAALLEAVGHEDRPSAWGDPLRWN